LLGERYTQQAGSHGVRPVSRHTRLRWFDSATAIAPIFGEI
jgi:hypothetical protein